MTKFKSGDKVVPINKTVKGFDSLSDSRNWNKANEVNQPFLYIQHFDDVVNAYVCNLDENTGAGCYFNEADLIPYKKVTKNERIATLENEVAELKLIVHELRERPQLTTVVNNAPQGPSTTNTVEDIIEFEGKQYLKVNREAREGDYVSVSFENGKCFKPNKIYGPVFEDKGLSVKADPSSGGEYEIALVYNKLYGRKVETVDVYELIKSKPLTPNQQRAAIIEKAKKFLETTKTSVSGYDANKPELHVNFENVYSPKYKGNKAACTAEFIIVKEKSKVVVLLKGISTNKVYARGIAKCNPSDVFNEDIGKAIALGRALGLDVSEFEQAVQPTVAVQGTAVYYKSKTGSEFIATIEKEAEVQTANTDLAQVDGHWKATIINDTNAKYEEGQ